MSRMIQDLKLEIEARKKLGKPIEDEEKGL